MSSATTSPEWWSFGFDISMMKFQPSCLLWKAKLPIAQYIIYCPAPGMVHLGRCFAASERQVVFGRVIVHTHSDFATICLTPLPRAGLCTRSFTPTSSLRTRKSIRPFAFTRPDQLACTRSPRCGHWACRKKARPSDRGCFRQRFAKY